MSGFVVELLTASAKGALVAGCVALVLAAVGYRLPASIRHALWLLVVVRLLVPMAPESPWSLLSLGAAGGALLPGLDPRPLGAALADAAPALAAGAGPPAAAAERLLTVAGWVWLAGFVLVAGRALGAELRLRRALRGAAPPADPRLVELAEETRAALGVRRPVAVVETGCVRSPAVHGLLAPRILLPPGYACGASEETLRHVLLHEMAHLARRDLPLRALAWLAAALHWFDPAAWWALRRLDAESDLACDAAVLARLGGSERAAYGHTLLAAVTPAALRSAAPVAALPFSTHRTLERRIRMIANFRPVSRRRLAALSVAVAAAAAVMLTDAPAAAGPADLDDLQKQRQRETLQAMRDIGTALFEWRTLEGDFGGDGGETPRRFDWSRCAPLDRAGLTEVLGAEAAARLPATDGWGHPLELCLDRSRRAGRYALGVRSAGRDGAFDGEVYAPGPYLANELDRDVVWMDGYFIAWPSADGR